jgi:hypothetical protein
MSPICAALCQLFVTKCSSPVDKKGANVSVEAAFLGEDPEELPTKVVVGGRPGEELHKQNIKFDVLEGQ